MDSSSPQSSAILRNYLLFYEEQMQSPQLSAILLQNCAENVKLLAREIPYQGGGGHGGLYLHRARYNTSLRERLAYGSEGVRSLVLNAKLLY